MMKEESKIRDYAASLLDEVNLDVGDLDNALDNFENKLNSIESRLENLEAKVSSIENKIRGEA
jgi:predicted  nucleic acid-binding Zn-ribbon protein